MLNKNQAKDSDANLDHGAILIDGDEIRFQVWRDGQIIEVKVTFESNKDLK